MKAVIRRPLAILFSLTFLISGCSDFLGSANVKSPARENGGQVPQKGSEVLPADFLNPNEGEFSERKMLINLGTQVFAKQAESFANQLPILKESLEQYCGDMRSGISAETSKAQAQADWKRAMLAFHSLEGAPFGPFVNRGRFIADYLYAFPYLNTCGIDQNVVASAKEPLAVGSLLYNVRGLGAIEYLLFESSLKSKCNVRANPHIKIWNELPASVKSLQRCEWALALVNDAQEKAELLKTDWSVKGGNYTLQLVEGKIYSNEKEALNALTDALSHIEFLKDTKLGRPLGRHRDCSEEKCPEDVEHRFSGISLEAADSQLRSFRILFYGSSDRNVKAFGFDDLLGKVGRQDVVDRMTVAMDKALVSLRAIQQSGTLEKQIEEFDATQCKASNSDNRLVEICAVHADVREVAFIFKTEVLVALSLRAPPAQQGDND